MGSAAGEALTSARKAADELDLGRALELAQQGLAKGDARVEETWALHALMGEVAASMGYPDAAVESFRKTLELSPGYQLPPTASPRLLEPFRKAQEGMKGTRLTGVSTSARVGDEGVQTTVQLSGDTEQLVSGARLFIERDGRFEQTDMARTDVFLARWSCRGCQGGHYVLLHDGAGNGLLSLGRPGALLYVPASAMASDKQVEVSPPGVEETSPKRWYRRPGPYLVAGAVALAATSLYFGLRFDKEQRSLEEANRNRAEHSYTEVLALDESRQRDFALTWAALGLAAGTGATAVWLW